MNRSRAIRSTVGPLALSLALWPDPVDAQSLLPRPEPGRSLVLVEGKRPAEVDEPVRVVTAPDGRLFLVDRGKEDVLGFDANRVWKRNLSGLLGGDRFDDPIRAVVDSEGRVHVAEAGTGTVWVLDDRGVVRRIGGRGEEPGRFERLADIAIDLDDHLYAADSRGGSIQVFTPDGLLAGSFDGFGGIAFREPVLVAVDPARRIVVYDRGEEVVTAGDADGAVAWRFSIRDRFDGRDDLVDLTVDAEGRVYLLDRRSGRAWVLDREGALLGPLFGRGSPPGGFRRPVSITADAGGAIHVLDEEDLRVQEFSVAVESPVAARPRLHRGVGGDGRTWRPVARSTAGEDERWLAYDGAGYSVRAPDGRSLGRVAVEPPEDGPVAAGGRDGFLVVDRGDRLHRVGADGAVLGEIARRTAGGELKRPRSLAIRADGVLAVYDEDDHDLLLLDADGTYRQRIGRPGRGPGEVEDVVAVDFDAAGNLLVLDRRGTRVQQFDPYGAFLDDAPFGAGGPRPDAPFADLAADPFGGVWIARPDAGLVTRFDERLEPVCSIGDPQRVPRPIGLVVGADGTAWTRGVARDGQAIPLACDGPPPRPLPPVVTLSGDPPDVVLRWSAGLPGAVAWSIRREAGGEWREIARVEESSWTMPEETWASAPAGLALAGIDAKGRAGPLSEPVEDVFSPTLAALDDGRASDAERWLQAAAESVRAAAPGDAAERLTALGLARARAAAVGGDFERALGIVDDVGEAPEAEAVATRVGIYREAIRAAVAGGDGAAALTWLDRLAGSAPERLSPVEIRARRLADAGEGDVAARLLQDLGAEPDPGTGSIDRAVAEIRMALGQYRAAVVQMIDAYRAASGPAEREDLDRALAMLAEAAIEQISERGAGAAAAGEVLAELDSLAVSLDGPDRERWQARVAALSVKPRIQAALDLAASDFAAAREALETALAEAGSIFVEDEVRARAALGELALAAGQRDEAREQFRKVLEIRPEWSPDPEEFSPTVREFVESVRHREGSPP